MGRRGPPPKPTKLKLAEGNPGHRPINAREPKPDVEAPHMPAWLPPRAKVEWKRIVPELLRLGLLAKIDQAALIGYCVACSELEAATKSLEQEGRVCRWPVLADEDLIEVSTDEAGKVTERLVAKKGQKIGEKLKSHPAVQQQRDALQRIKQYIGEFGLSPASRSRVAAADTVGKPVAKAASRPADLDPPPPKGKGK